MKEQIIKGLAPHVSGEGHDLEAWAERQADFAETFCDDESKHAELIEAVIKDALEMIRKGLKLK